MPFKQIVMTLLLISAVTLGASSPLPKWTKNYKTLVTLLEGTKEVGQCAISLSSDPNSPQGSWVISFLQNPGGLISFDITPPEATNGQSQVDILARNTLRYRQSDIAGWTNLVIELDSSHKSILKIDMNKTLPDGSIYDQGPICGSSTH